MSWKREDPGPFEGRAYRGYAFQEATASGETDVRDRRYDPAGGRCDVGMCRA